MTSHRPDILTGILRVSRPGAPMTTIKKSFGADVLSSDSPVLEAFVAEAVVGDNLDRALTGADPHPHLS